MIKRMLQIEENLLENFQTMFFVAMNSNSAPLISKKYSELYEKIMEEQEDLGLENVSTRRLEIILNQLLYRIEPITFEEYAYTNTYLWSPYFRLLNQFQQEWVKRNQRANNEDYYRQIYNNRLLESYFNICTILSDHMSKNYLGIYYYMMYTFPSLEDYTYQIPLGKWISNPQEYKKYEQKQVLHKIEKFLDLMQSLPTKEVKRQITFNDFYFYFYSYIQLAKKHFTFQEFDDKIRMFIKEKGKQEYIKKLIKTPELPLEIIK